MVVSYQAPSSAPWGPCFGMGECLGGRYFLALESTEVETKVQNQYSSFGKSSINRLIR